MRKDEVSSELAVRQQDGLAMGSAQALAARPYRTVAHGVLVLASFSVLFLLFFSPVLLSGGRSAKVLASGDAQLYYLPNFLSGVVLWDPLLQSGFPVAADPQAMTWYPLARLFSLLHSWNGFILSAYVLASSFTYGYLLAVTGSRLAAAVGGCTYGLSGFLIVHQGHVSIIHAAAWLPMLIWAMEAGRQKRTPGWLAAAAATVAMSVLSGHPQATIHVLATGAVYAVLRGLTLPGRLRYYGWCIASFVVGLLLAAIQLVPSAELARLGTRANLSYTAFTAVSLPPSQTMQLLFPMLFGATGLPLSFYGQPYFGASWFVELTGYVGLLPLLLAAMALAGRMRNRHVLLWGGIGLIAFLLALGSSGPFTWLLYHVPIYNRFNAPARHLMEFTFAISVLSGWGIVALEKGTGVRRVAIVGVVGLLALMALSIGYVHTRSGALRAAAAANGLADLKFSPGANPAVAVPLGVALLASVGLIAFAWKPQSWLRQGSVVLILVVDLGSFGHFLYWKYLSAETAVLRAPRVAERYRPLLAETHQRMLPVRGGQGGRDELPPNLSRLWGIPSASGYGPLILGRISEALSMQTDGAILGQWSDSRGRGIDLLAVRYVFMPTKLANLAPAGESEAARGRPEENEGRPVGSEDGPSYPLTYPLSLGYAAGRSFPSSARLRLAEPFTSTAVRVESSLGNSTGIEDGVPVAQVRLYDGGGQTEELTMLAGRDTSEWAHGCSDVLPHMRHRKAAVARSFDVVRSGFPTCEGHRYTATLPLARPRAIQKVEFRWLAAAGVLEIWGVALVPPGTSEAKPVTFTLSDPTRASRWRLAEEIGDTIIWENLRALPRAWLVQEVLQVSPQQALEAVRTSWLPDARVFDPLQVALVEEPFSLSGPSTPGGTARVATLSSTGMDVDVTVSANTFLVVSDVYYPGWKAYVDGTETRIYQTDFLLRGIPLSPGSHRVRFAYRPMAFYLGAALTACALTLLATVVALSLGWRYTAARGTETGGVAP